MFQVFLLKHLVSALDADHSVEIATVLKVRLHHAHWSPKVAATTDVHTTRYPLAKLRRVDHKLPDFAVDIVASVEWTTLSLC